jgi:NADP-dependent 3-hydroxy acid dehydrogenase YdfG
LLADSRFPEGMPSSDIDVLVNNAGNFFGDDARVVA